VGLLCRGEKKGIALLVSVAVKLKNQQEVGMNDQDELLQIREALEGFIEKHGGQYTCAVIWPKRSAMKGTIPMGSSHVKIMNSQPYDQAVAALCTGEKMFRKK